MSVSYNHAGKKPRQTVVTRRNGPETTVTQAPACAAATRPRRGPGRSSTPGRPRIRMPTATAEPHPTVRPVGRDARVAVGQVMKEAGAEDARDALCVEAERFSGPAVRHLLRDVVQNGLGVVRNGFGFVARLEGGVGVFQQVARREADDLFVGVDDPLLAEFAEASD